MAGAAAHLVNRVLPSIPLRQWVLTLPFQAPPRGRSHCFGGAATGPGGITATVDEDDGVMGGPGKDGHSRSRSSA